MEVVISTQRRPAVLVTGGRGFIGRHLASHLLNAGTEAVVSVDKLPVIGEPNSRCVEFVTDIRDAQSMLSLFLQYEFTTVFDLASITDVGLPEATYHQNIQMTQAMIDYVSKFNVPKYVFFSSQRVFRKERLTPAHDQDYFTTEAYGASKVESEVLIRRRLASGQWLILRPTYIWGEGHLRFRDGFLRRLANRQLLVPTDANLNRYYGYVRTTCHQAHLLAGSSELPSATFYLSDPPIPMVEFCRFFANALDVAPPRGVSGRTIKFLGRVGELAKAIGVPFPITGMQANEMTGNFFVPAEATWSLCKARTDYQKAASSVVDWALSDPQFRRSIGRAQ